MLGGNSVGGTWVRWWIAPAVLIAALLWALLDGGSGLPAWRRLAGDLGDAQARIAALRQELADTQAAAAALRDDPLALETAIREDLGFARPGETVVRLAEPAERPTQRNP